jgi:hypothetical protein
MTLPVTVDPRYHDAVIFNLDAALTDNDDRSHQFRLGRPIGA